MGLNIVKAFEDEPMLKIMVVAVLLLFLVIAFVISLHLYAKWYLLRSPATISTASVSSRHRRTDSSFGIRVGLDPRVLKSIPVMTFAEGEKGEECAVCLCEVAEGEKYRILPKCHHCFHLDCIDMWFASHTTCPLCRDPVSVPVQILVKSESPELNLETGRAAENMAVFPTNVLFWGNQVHISTHSVIPTEEEDESATSSVAVAIDMPRQVFVAEDEEQAGAVTTRLRSLKRMLSRDRKINPCSPSSHDATQL